MWSIAHKVEFARAYARLSWAMPDVFNFHPKTFILPFQMSHLQKYMASFSKRSARTVIVKPDRGSQGRGIQLVQDVGDLENYADSAVAQVYLKPYLLNGRKFDLRLYVLLTSCDPLRAYLFREGMARLCTATYEKPKAANLRNDYAHLTNFSLNRKSSAFDFSRNKKAMSDVFVELAALGVDIARLLAEMQRIVRLTLIAGQPVIAASYHTGVFTNDGKSRCFEILGFDIALDSQARPWLLEVNCMPSLVAYSEFDDDLKTRLVLSALKVVDLDCSFKGKVLRRFKNIRERRNSQATVFSAEREYALARETEWDQLLPVPDDPGAGEFCESVLAAVRNFGVPKRAVPAPVTEPEGAKSGHPRPSIKPRQLIAPPLPARTSRSGTLANEARTKVAVRRPVVSELMPPIFQVFPASENRDLLFAADEQARALAVRRPLAAMIALGEIIQALFPDGNTLSLPRRDPLPQGARGMFSIFRLVGPPGL
jgi:tubulin polyglutamylase TTLL6/13